MTKDILVYVSGLQIVEEKSEPIVLVTTGTYYFRNGKHFIIYEEVDEEGDRAQNTIKITPHMVDLVRKGMTSSHMIFEVGKENLTYYDTPFGSMLMGITTSSIKFEEVNELHMELEIQYALSVDSKHVSDCTIHITVKGSESE
jgi:uncharacterized beta-barrel protein YwiB (DUF1934 family)